MHNTYSRAETLVKRFHGIPLEEKSVERDAKKEEEKIKRKADYTSLHYSFNIV